MVNMSFAACSVLNVSSSCHSSEVVHDEQNVVTHSFPRAAAEILSEEKSQLINVDFNYEGMNTF